MAAIGILLFFLLGGVLIVRFLLPGKNPLTRTWLGAALGVLLLMHLPALFAHIFRFSVKAHIASVIALAILTMACFAFRDRTPLQRMREKDKDMLLPLAFTVLPLTVFSFYLQYTHVLMPHPDGSLWCGQSTYGDMNMHLAFITSMREMAFPPSYNLLYNTPLSYPYLTDSLSTSMLLLGLPLNWAVIVPGTLLMALTYVGYMLLCRSVLGDRRKAVVLCAALFFLNGGLGFLYDFDMAGRDGLERVKEIFTGYYKTPANQPDFNLRFSNVIADLMLPQRGLLGGWAMVLPALYLLFSAQRAQSMRQTVMLALWASALPMVHTHTFLALGLFSGGYLIGRMLQYPNERKGILARSGVYLLIVLVLAAPQVLRNAVRQTLQGGVLRFQFNWVNNSGGLGMIDGYFWFWIKNAGLPYILAVCACLNARRRGLLPICLGMTTVYVVAEFVLFQRNEYDNNKLFYIWFMFAIILSVDYGSVIMQRLAGLGGRNLLCALFIGVSVCSGALSLAREAVSGYQLFSPNAVYAARWIEHYTDRDDVFLTGQQHINPVCSLAGRQIVCGSNLYVFFHGLDYAQQADDCRLFYEKPAEHADVLERYGVDYIYISDYELADFDVDIKGIKENHELIYENPDVQIYRVLH